MRQFIIAASIALGLIAIWAAVLPLTAQPAPAQAASAAMSRALFLCRGATGIDRACVATLAKALVLDGKDATVTRVNARYCPVDGQILASLDSRD